MEKKDQMTGISVIIPVYNGLEHIKKLFSTLSVHTTYPDCRIIVVDDNSPDHEVQEVLHMARSADPRIVLVRNDENLGFVRSVNVAMRMSEGRHCVLLNSDTQVPKGWLERLIRPIEEDPNVASVTPFSNGALWFSLPVARTDNVETMRRFSVEELDAIVSRLAMSREYAETPIGHGFCMAMNASVIAQIGILDEESFGRGYGEEADWCLRATVAGYRHMLAPDLFVAHYHCGSFASAEKRRLIAEHGMIINSRYPFYHDAMKAHFKGNGVEWRRIGQAMQEELIPRWNAGRPAKRILLVSHEMTITGAPKSLLRQACYFRDAGHIVDVWTMRSGSFAQQFLNEGFEVTTVERSDMVKACQEAVGRYALIICNTFTTYRFVKQFAKSEPVAWFVREIASAKRAVAANKEVDALLRAFPCIYTVSSYAKEVLSAYNYEISYFNNSVVDEFSAFDVVGANIRFGYIGAINENKNVEGLIDAFMAAQKVFPGITLDVCGKDITKTGLIDRLMHKTQGMTSIRWLGEVFGDEKDAFFHSIDVLCVPSLSESSCLSLIEGAMRGKAVISTMNVGANYVLECGGGIIVPAGSTEALEKALTTLAAAPHEVKRMQRAAREGYLKYGTVEKERAAVLKMLQDVPMRAAAARMAAIRRQAEDSDGAVRLPVVEALDSNVKISVIVPVYNMQRYLRECLDSILSQTLRNIEVICVNDGSTDGTRGILHEYEEGDSRVRVIDQENGGAGKARNSGLAVARGEYICFVDPDDFIDRDMLLHMCRNADAKGSDIVICRIKRFDSSTGETIAVSSFSGGVVSRLKEKRHTVSALEMKDELFFMAGYGPCNKIFRHSLIKKKKISFQEIRRTNDMFFVTTALANSKLIAISDKPFYHYRKGIESVTTKDEYAASFCDACKAVRARLMSDGLYETFEKCFVLMVLNSLLNNVQTCYDYRVLQKLYPRMRAAILPLIPTNWVFSNVSMRRAYKVLRASDDPLAMVRFLFDQARERNETVNGVMARMKLDAQKGARVVQDLREQLEEAKAARVKNWNERTMYVQKWHEEQAKVKELTAALAVAQKAAKRELPAGEVATLRSKNSALVEEVKVQKAARVKNWNERMLYVQKWREEQAKVKELTAALAAAQKTTGDRGEIENLRAQVAALAEEVKVQKAARVKNWNERTMYVRKWRAEQEKVKALQGGKKAPTASAPAAKPIAKPVAKPIGSVIAPDGVDITIFEN